MKCPYCGCTESKVIDSRPAEDSEKIRRRRECTECEKRFTTYEIIEQVPIMVIKKDGSREVFDSDKLFRSLQRACEKRRVSTDQLAAAVTDIENEIRGNLDREVSSETIGELSMEKLKELDEVAYVRFASVYRQFKDINTFMDELQKLLTEK